MAWNNAPIPAASAGRIHPYRQQRLPTPGMENAAVYPAFSLPAYSVQGPGFIYGGGRGPAVVSPYPQLDYVRAFVVNGINGIVFGGAYQQSLISPDAYANGKGS